MQKSKFVDVSDHLTLSDSNRYIVDADIPGAEKAGKLAKQATMLPKILENCKMGLSEIKALIINYFKQEADEIWHNKNHISKDYIPSIHHGKYLMTSKFIYTC